jgi:hypothetical protein
VKKPLIDLETLARIDLWREEHPEHPPREEAIRILLGRALATPPIFAPKRSPGDVARQELAASKPRGPVAVVHTLYIR